MTTILTVLGTRPEIIKLSPLLPLLDTRYRHVLVHTGQHYDHALDGVFFDELRLRAPDYRLEVGSGSHGLQTARMLAALDPILDQVRPDAVVVQGDTNSTLAGALLSSKRHIPVIHLEAGCRSFNRHMPEELNRIMVDHCADLLLAADGGAARNLRAEGLPNGRIHVVGSTAIDACLRSVRFANRSGILQRLDLRSREYLLCTIHRAENTTPAVLPGLVQAINQLARQQQVVVPLHPRTAAALAAQQLAFDSGVQVIEPLGYLDLLQLLRHATAVLTDSGGVQEGAAARNGPRRIFRQETQWEYHGQGPHAPRHGKSAASILAGAALALRPEALAAMRSRPCISLGGAAQRIMTIIAEWLAAGETDHAPTLTHALRTLAVGA